MTPKTKNLPDTLLAYWILSKVLKIQLKKNPFFETDKSI